MKLLLWVAKFLTKTNFTKWYRHVCIICQMICAASWHLIEVDVSSAFISNISQYKYDIWHFLGTTWSIHSKTCDWGVYSTIKTYLHPKYNFIWWIYYYILYDMIHIFHLKDYFTPTIRGTLLNQFDLKIAWL